jgi:hypothetical protein
MTGRSLLGTQISHKKALHTYTHLIAEKNAQELGKV